jgi:hypothetical protein
MIYIRLPSSNMLNLQLPVHGIGLAGAPAVAGAAGAAVQPKSNIQSYLQNPQTTLFNGRLENRIMSVVGTDGVLIVSIPRRTYKALSGSIYNLPQVFNMSAMPHHAYGVETLNNTKIKTNLYLKISNTNNDNADIKQPDKLFLKSVVSLKEQTANNNTFIYGSKTYIFSHTNQDITVYDPIKNNNLVQRPIRKCNNNNTMADLLDRGVRELPEVPLLPVGAAVVRSRTEIDYVKDFDTNQTLLIYTNELTNLQVANNAITERYADISNTEYTDNFNNINLRADNSEDNGDTPLMQEHFQGHWNVE